MTVDAALARYRWALWLLFAVGFFALFGARAGYRDFWFDELFTYYVTIQPTFGDVLDRLQERLDQHPPLFYWLERLALGLSTGGEPLIALRLPGMLAVFAGLACIFEIVRRRHSDLVAWIAVLAPLNSFVADHAFEARPYGLVFGFSALAALAYLRAQESNRRKTWLLVMGVALFAAVSVCYYAVLAFVPFALAEAVRSWERRRLDWGTLAAIAAPAALTVVYAPLAMRNVSRFLPVNWATPTVERLQDNYVWLMNGLPEAGVFLLAAWACWRALGGEERVPEAPAAPVPRSYAALAMGFVLLPVVLYVVAKLVTHKMHPRYVIEASVGVAILVAGLSAVLLHRRSAAIGLVFLAGLTANAAYTHGLPIYWSVLYPRQDPSLARWLEHQPTELPVVVDNPMKNLELAHQNPRGIRDRLYYLVDPPTAQHLAPVIVNGGETWLKSQRHMPVQAPMREEFIARNPDFLLYYSNAGQADYVMRRALEEGARVELLNFESFEWEARALYRVRYPASAPSSSTPTDASTK